MRRLLVVLALLLVPSLLSAQEIGDKYRLKRERDSKFNLTSSPTVVLAVNLFQCGLRNQGDTCSDVFNSPTGGGGFWPTGTANDYMFNSGLKIAGIIPRDAGFAWAGDTVGAFFFDASGLRAHGTPITEIYNSLDPDDLENWPVAGTFPDFPNASAMVEDTALFNSVLIGRKAASQQDTWVMYWDGDPGPTGGRTHPMGILVEQRSLAWNYPLGNESVIYFIYKFTNVTNNALFQRLNEVRFFGGQNALPDAGWRFDSIYVASAADPDVTHDFRANYATAILPFNMGIAYDGTMFEPDWDYPPNLFFPPFFTNSPGIVGIKYLQSPRDPATGEDIGLSAFSLFTNGAPFRDPIDVQAGWRYLSLNVDGGKGDPSCTFSIDEAKARRSCFLNQSQADTRFFMASGPFSLGPGESATVAVAMFAAATVATPQIQRGASADNKPGFPTLAPGCFSQPIRPIEVGAGWVSTRNCPTDGDEVDQFDVQVVPNSLLGKALVAQSIFDNKFLLGFAPDPPNFYLVPGDNQVTVVWEPSRTEQTGDPFFVAAGDPTNPLFDPNYRQNDVEGYRIYRGTDPSNLRLIAQFDKVGTQFVDRRCVTDPAHVTADPCTVVHNVDLTGEFIQFTTVAKLADGSPLVVDRDVLFEDLIEAGAARELSDTGIPFAFIDTEARNGFQYFYRVTAFDVNSVISGPSSLESAGPSKNVTPRKAATTLSAANFSVGLFGRAASPLLVAPVPELNPTTGTFSGPMPPTNGLTGDFIAFATQLLPAGVKEVRIDSVLPRYYPNGNIAQMFVTADGQTANFLVPNIVASGTPEVAEIELPVVSVAADAAVRQQLISRGVDAPPLSGSLTAEVSYQRPHWHSNWEDWAFKQPGFWQFDPPVTTDAPGGSRWFTGANESAADPTLGLKKWGEIANYTIFKPNPYWGTVAPLATPGLTAYPALNGTTYAADLVRRVYAFMHGVVRAADVKLYWGAAGLDSVVDVTHNVRVPFKPSAQAAYGFLADNDGNGVLNWGDFLYMPNIHEAGQELATLAPFAKPLVNQPVVMATDIDGNLTGDGDGFGLFINGEMWLFRGARPANTVWTLRTYNGAITKNSAGQYQFQGFIRNPAIPGLSFRVQVESAAQIVAANADLSKVHTVPDPFYAASLFDRSPAAKELQFVNLPAAATIRIYSLSGVLVDIVTHDDPQGGGRATWDMRNRSGQFVASGVYMYHVSTPDGKTAIGKFTVVNSGFAR